MNEMLSIIAYFIIYSFIGWLLESTYKSVNQGKFINSGFLHGPLCPIYGYGAMIMYLLLKDLTNNIFILFLFGLIVLSVFEYIVGLFLELVFKTKYWDYSKRKFNIHGRVCLLNSLYWGILGIVFMDVIHPLVMKLVGIIPKKYLIVAVSGILALMLIDTVITIIGLIKINIKLKNWEKITEDIKSKLEAIDVKRTATLEKIKALRLKDNSRILAKVSELRNRENVLGELKQRQQFVQETLEKRIARLKRNFPTMNSERLSKFLNNNKKS